MPEGSGLRRSDSKEQTAKGSSEAALIRRASQGDVEAFNRLVLRHRQSVLHFAWTMVRDWDLAEDLAQQTLLEAYRGLSGLREPRKFRAWLLTIARRRAMRHWGSLASQPPTIEFSESVIYPLTHEPSLLASDEVSDRIRESLLELSSRNRQVMALHYLDGYSCNEISGRLSIPAGTVKRILHESRNRLRTGMGIAAKAPHPGGGLSKMETKKKLGPRNLQWWINGSWPGPIMDGLMPRAICLAANKKAKITGEIAKEIDANAAFVEEALGPLVHEGLVSKTEDDKYLTNFIAMDAADWIATTAGIREFGIHAADFLLPYLPLLENAWNKTTLPERGFPWEQGIWPVLSLLLCNQGVSRQLGSGPEAPMRASGKRYWAGGHEIVDPRHELWTVGFSLTSPKDALIGYGHLWSFGLRREYLYGWPDERSMVFTALSKGISETEQIARDADLPLEQVREIVADLIKQGAAAQGDRGLSLLFPVFGKAESDILTPVIDQVAVPLVNDLLKPATADLADKLRAAGYEHLEEQFRVWQGWLMGNISGEAVRELLNRGVLPDPGDPAPANFARIGWEKDLPLMTWHTAA
jgi:RNA polymerase sigma factor (sigma-70 family)